MLIILQTRKREEEEVMQQLTEEEQKEEMERQQQTELERKFRRRIEARQAHRDQMADRMKRLQQEAQDEARYKQRVNMYEDIGSTLHDLVKSCYYFLHPLTYLNGLQSHWDHVWFEVLVAWTLKNFSFGDDILKSSTNILMFQRNILPPSWR